MLKRWRSWFVLVWGVGAPVAAQTPPLAVLEHYAVVVHASYQDSLAAARTMREAIHMLLAAPSAARLQHARHSWLAARETYGQTEQT